MRWKHAQSTHEATGGGFVKSIETMTTLQSQVKLSILLPVRNEGVNLRVMVKLLTAMLDVPHELLIVYDFPEDDSIAVIHALQERCTNLRLVQIGRASCREKCRARCAPN